MVDFAPPSRSTDTARVNSGQRNEFDIAGACEQRLRLLSLGASNQEMLPETKSRAVKAPIFRLQNASLSYGSAKRTVALVALCLLAGCVRAGFDAAPFDDGLSRARDLGSIDRGTVDAAPADGALSDGFTADSPAFAGGIVVEGLVGTSQCTSGGGTTLTVPAGLSLSAGQTLIIAVAVRASPEGAVSASDNRANIYQLDLDVRHDSASSGIRMVILSAYLENALNAGDTIFVTHPDADANAVVASMFSGVADAARVGKTSWAQGESRSPSASLTLDEDGMVYGFVGVSSEKPIGAPSDWKVLHETLIDCGGAPQQARALLVARSGFASQEVTLSVVLSSSPKWTAGMVHYRPAP